MTGRSRTVTVTDRGTTIVLTGYRVADIARSAGLRPIFNGVAQGWVTDATRYADLLAYCESRRIAVAVVSADAAVGGEDHLLRGGEDHLLRGADRGGDQDLQRGDQQLHLFGGEVA